MWMARKRNAPGHQLGKVAHLVEPLFRMSHTLFQQQPRYAVLHLHHLLDQQSAVAQRSAPVADLGRSHVTLWKEIATKTVGDLAGIDLVVLALGCGDGSQHQGVRYLHLFRMWKQVVIDPAGEDRRFDGDRTGLRKGLNPNIQLAPARSHLAFHVHTASRVLHAIADRPLVNIQYDVIHSL